jgi:tetratricopeptide (TPR) repeat protein
MIVTLPFVLLLMDYWPLRRLNLLCWKRTVLEKLPFVALSAIVSFITVLVQNNGGAVRDFDALPFSVRLENATVSVFRYIYKLIWPVDLAVLYPYEKWPAVTIFAAVTAFVAVAMLTFVLRKRSPWLAFGWFWFIVSLLPVLGLVQVGMQSMADRYTYIPSIGLFVAVSFGAAEMFERVSHVKIISSIASILALTACGWLTFKQVQFWRNSETLFTHTLAVTRNNHIIHNNLGFELQEQGRLDEALAQFQAAEKIDSRTPETHNNLACVYLAKGMLDESIRESMLTLKLRPQFAEAQFNLGHALYLKGDTSKGLKMLLEAIEHLSQNPTAHFDLAEALIKEGQTDQAQAHLIRALDLNPAMTDARLKLATLLVAKGDLPAAAKQYRTVLHEYPDSVEALNNLAWILATARQ